MSNLLTVYRLLATVVGLLLVPLFLGWGVELAAVGVWHERAADFTNIAGPIHGLLYMLFFFAAVVLARRAAWDLPFAAVTIVCGTIPVASFWAEHRATARVRTETLR